MAISLRLDKGLEHELSRWARFGGTSKSDVIRSLISDFVKKKSTRRSAWEIGRDVFGKVGSGKGNLSVDRRAILKEKLNAKKHRH